MQFESPSAQKDGRSARRPYIKMGEQAENPGQLRHRFMGEVQARRRVTGRRKAEQP